MVFGELDFGFGSMAGGTSPVILSFEGLPVGKGVRAAVALLFDSPPSNIKILAPGKYPTSPRRIGFSASFKHFLLHFRPRFVGHLFPLVRGRQSSVPLFCGHHFFNSFFRMSSAEEVIKYADPRLGRFATSFLFSISSFPKFYLIGVFCSIFFAVFSNFFNVLALPRPCLGYDFLSIGSVIFIRPSLPFFF